MSAFKDAIETVVTDSRYSDPDIRYATRKLLWSCVNAARWQGAALGFIVGVVFRLIVEAL